MDETNIIASLLTPASDLVTGALGPELEVVFGRAGNDSVYGFDPGVGNTQESNIDFLFGDLFDNSVEEFEIILNIQTNGQGGNPLLILERDIPSVGADRFVLGDEIQPYYTTYDTLSLITTNLFGTKQFAVIYDFDPAQDTIQLNGDKDDYFILELNNLEVEGIDQPFFGEGIFSLQQGLPDLVGYVITTPEVDLNLNDKYFRFVGEQPEKKPTRRRIGQLGTTGIDVSTGTATDESGNIYLTGYTSGALGGKNQGLVDSWVAKYNSSGNQLFLKQFGTSAGDKSNAIATDKEGNFYLAGVTGGDLFSSTQSSSDAWLAKYNSNGNLVWGRQLGENVTNGFASDAFGIDVTEAGDVYVSGLAIKNNQNTDIFDFSVEDDSWVAKFDSDGNRQWFTEFDTFFFNENYDLAVDAEGNAYAVGWTQGLVEESDPSRNLLKYDAWISKLNPDGEIEWIQQLGSVDEGLEFAWGVDTDSEGNVYATGWTTGDLGDRPEITNDSYDIWLAKFSPDSTKQWVKQFGTTNDDGTFLSDLEIDDQDNIFLTGYTNGRLNGRKTDDYDAFVARFDTEGNNEWVRRLGSKTSLDYGTALSSYNNKLYVTGFTEGYLGSNLGTEANGAAVDSWVAQLNSANGQLQRVRGNADDFVSTNVSTSLVVEDVTDELVTDEDLPSGDNRIDLTEGIDTPVEVVDLGQVVDNLGEAFDPEDENSVVSEIVDSVAETPEGEEALIPPDSEVVEVENLQLNGTDGPDTLAGGAGDDTIRGQKGADFLVGDAGNDILRGGQGKDTIQGGQGNDEIFGGRGNDVIIGVDPENQTELGLNEIDKLTGKNGGDRFILGSEDQAYYVDDDLSTDGVGDYALITDFQAQDVIELTGTASDYTLSDFDLGDIQGTGIFLTKDQSTPELIAVLADIAIDQIALEDSNSFTFV